VSLDDDDLDDGGASAMELLAAELGAEPIDDEDD
jgi:hypothetical protein